MKKAKTTFKFTYTKKLLLLATVFVLTVAGILPALGTRQALAGQIATRQLKISSGVPSATSVTYTFGASTGGSDPTNGFFFNTSHIVKGMKFLACTTAVGSCSA